MASWLISEPQKDVFNNQYHGILKNVIDINLEPFSTTTNTGISLSLGISLFCYYFHLLFFLVALFLVTYYAQDLVQSSNILLIYIASYLTVTSYTL